MLKLKLVLLGSCDLASKPALFLDRDGVINVDTGYVGRAEDVLLVEGVAPCLREFNRRQIPVICVTNQSGIARGYYGWNDFIDVHSRIDALLSEAGAHIDAVFASGAGPGDEHAPNSWRKPAPGMFIAAREVLKVDLSRSIIVGDKISDLIAGQRAGLSAGALVASSPLNAIDYADLKGLSRSLIVGTSLAGVTAQVFAVLSKHTAIEA